MGLALATRAKGRRRVTFCHKADVLPLVRPGIIVTSIVKFGFGALPGSFAALAGIVVLTLLAIALATAGLRSALGKLGVKREVFSSGKFKGLVGQHRCLGQGAHDHCLKTPACHRHD